MKSWLRGSYPKLPPGTAAWWTGRDLNPRPYGAGLVPSRKQGPVAGPAKRAIFGLTLSVYQADLPAHRKTRPTQRLLNWFAHRVLPINCMLSQALLLTKQPGRGQTQPSEDHGGRIEHRLNTPQIIGDARKNSSYSNSAAQHQTVESHGRTLRTRLQALARRAVSRERIGRGR